MIKIIKKIKSKLGFTYRGLRGIFDNLSYPLYDLNEVEERPYSESGFSIGKTLNGEEITCYSFGSGEESILYFGGIHGNEVGTVKLMNNWVNYLYDNESDIGDKQIFIIPCLNIDGYNTALKKAGYFSGGVFGKTNANNVDLNRNFPTSNWSSQSKLFAAGKYSDISGGISAGSEAEIKILLSVIKKKNITTVYTFHNCWGTVFGKTSPQFPQSRERIDKKVQSYFKNSGYRIFTDSEWDKLKPEQKTGHMMVWAEEKGVDVIEIETRTRWGSEWKQNKKALIESLKL